MRRSFPTLIRSPASCWRARGPKPSREGETPAETETMAACEVPREHWHDRMDLAAFVSGRRQPVPTRLLRKEGWSLENPMVQALLEKIRTSGVPLQGACEGKTITWTPHRIERSLRHRRRDQGPIDPGKREIRAGDKAAPSWPGRRPLEKPRRQLFSHHDPLK